MIRYSRQTEIATKGRRKTTPGIEAQSHLPTLRRQISSREAPRPPKRHSPQAATPRIDRSQGATSPQTRRADKTDRRPSSPGPRRHRCIGSRRARCWRTSRRPTAAVGDTKRVPLPRVHSGNKQPPEIDADDNDNARSRENQQGGPVSLVDEPAVPDLNSSIGGPNKTRPHKGQTIALRLRHFRCLAPVALGGGPPDRVGEIFRRLRARHREDAAEDKA